MYKYYFILYWLILDILTLFLLYKLYKLGAKNFKLLKKFNIKFIFIILIIFTLLVIFIYYTRNHIARNSIRNNHFRNIIVRIFNLNNHTHNVKNINDMLDIVKENNNITIGGSCWSMFLNKKSSHDIIYTDNINKKINETETTITYQCGALITDIQNELIKKNKTLCEFPSLEWITIGGWLNPGCHGHPGSLPKQLFKSCKFYDRESQEIFIRDYRNSLNYFGVKRYILLEVEFIKYDDIVVKNDTFIVNNIDHCKKWLSNNTLGRLLFCGKRGTIGTIWYENDETKLLSLNYHGVDNYNSKLFNQWYTMDIESWISSNIIDIDIKSTVAKLKKDFNYQRFSRCNQTVPGFLPELSCIALLLNVYNFEIFTSINCTPQFLNILLTNLENFHKNFGGRTEIRLREPNILMIDWSLQTYDEIKKSFKLMYSLGIHSLYIHKGKYIVNDITPCKLVDYNKLFNSY